MTRGAAGALVALAACWTGPDAPPPVAPPAPQPAPIDLQVSLERTACFGGSCPIYNVVVSGEGAVTWHGVANVRELGMRRAKVPRRNVELLARAIEDVRFFDLAAQAAERCTNTSHAIVIVRRSGRMRRVDDARCPNLGDGKPTARHVDLEELEELIDRFAAVARWR